MLDLLCHVTCSVDPGLLQSRWPIYCTNNKIYVKVKRSGHSQDLGGFITIKFIKKTKAMKLKISQLVHNALGKTRLYKFCIDTGVLKIFERNIHFF